LMGNQLPPYGANPPPYPPVFGDVKSPEQFNVAGRPGYGQRPYAANAAAGQRQQFHGRRNSGESMYSDATSFTAYSSSTGYTQPQVGGMAVHPMPPGGRLGDRIPGPQPKRSYGNLAAAQAAISSNSRDRRLLPQQQQPDYENDPYGGTIDDYSSEYGDGMSDISRGNANPTVPILSRPNQPYVAPTPIQQAPVIYDDYSYRPPPGPRSGSPTPSLGSNSSRGGGRTNQAVPTRYQQDNRAPRYNNYAQQGGRRVGGGVP